ncbi:MAG TPA: SDR family oxidoreductase [Armatimonadota bacterium]
MIWGEELRGRAAVVTGGSEGIGLDLCRGLVEAGCRVVFCARREEKGREAQASLGPLATFVRADVTDWGDLQALAGRVAGEAGRLDYLVNNVASDDRIPFEEVTPEACDRLWEVNLRSYLLATRAFVDLLRAGEGKSVVNIGTTNYLLGFAGMSVYGATKSGILGFTRALARELGPEGIRANMVSPGWVMTEKQLREYVSEQDKRDLLRDQCLKMLLEPRHITSPVLFLLSSGASAVTGQHLVVDCGKFLY